MRRPATIQVLTFALLLWASTAVGTVYRRARRQAIDTSNIADDEFICLLQGTCAMPSLPVQSPSCRCVKWWECQDSFIPRGDDQGIVAVIDVRNSCPNDPNDICCDTVVDVPVPAPTAPPTPVNSGCGLRNEFGVTANYKGFTDRQAQFGEFPWMAVVLQHSTAGRTPEYVSGGSLIHPRVILTAAHHVRSKVASELFVRLGEWNLKVKTEPIAHQEIRVNEILLHPNYVPTDEFNDFALLFLEREATMGPTVGTVCLPNPGQTFDGSRCFSSGWGKDIFGRRGKFQQILKSIDLPVVNHGQCERILKASPRLNPNFFLHSSFMCAGGERNKDVCTGDGGSPLMCPIPGNPTRYVQAGVVAWGLGCGQAGMPGVYAAVSQGMPWISQALQQRNMGFDIRVG